MIKPLIIPPAIHPIANSCNACCGRTPATPFEVFCLQVMMGLCVLMCIGLLALLVKTFIDDYREKR